MVRHAGWPTANPPERPVLEPLEPRFLMSSKESRRQSVKHDREHQGGEQVNLDAADILIPGDDPRLMSRFVALSRKTKRAVRQNIIMSVVITCALVWSVLQGINDQLWIGVLLHEASAVLVILNGARIAGDDGIFKLLRSVVMDLWIDFKEAWQSFSSRNLPKPMMSRA